MSVPHSAASATPPFLIPACAPINRTPSAGYVPQNVCPSHTHHACCLDDTHHKPDRDMIDSPFKLGGNLGMAMLYLAPSRHCRFAGPFQFMLHRDSTLYSFAHCDAPRRRQSACHRMDRYSGQGTLSVLWKRQSSSPPS